MRLGIRLPPAGPQTRRLQPTRPDARGIRVQMAPLTARSTQTCAEPSERGPPPHVPLSTTGLPSPLWPGASTR
ncbi:hypothetical protein ACFPRL_16650 [Pseudoclavibacter helvolus]